MMRFLPFLLAGALPVVACSSQVDSSYRGDPLLSVEGRVVATSATTASEVDAAIAWIPTQQMRGGEPPRPSLIGARIPVTGAFPASFRVEALSPPPAGAQIPGATLDGLSNAGNPAWEPKGSAIGVLIALARSANGPAIEPRDVLGVDRRHVIVWVDHEPEDREDYLKGFVQAWRIPAKRGYQILTTAPEARSRLFECLDQGICIRYSTEPCQTTAFLAGADAYRYEQCSGRSTRTCAITDDETCAGTPVQLSPDQAAENARCRQFASEQDTSLAAVTDCYRTYHDELSTLPNAPVEIELGQSIFAALAGTE